MVYNNNNNSKIVSFRLSIDDYDKLVLISKKLFNKINVSKTINYLIYIYLKSVKLE